MYNFMKSFMPFVLFFYLLFASTLNAFNGTETENWLVNEINTNMLMENQTDIALASQAIRESVLALQQRGTLSRLDESMVLAPFELIDENSTEFLASKIIVFKTFNKDVGSLFDKLIMIQNIDGGFGHSKGHQSTALDTALALEVLYLSSKHSSAASALSYLIAQQQADGSWSDFSTNSSSYTTAFAMRALWMHRKSFDIQASLERSKSFLASLSIANETFLNALILRSIAPLYYNGGDLENRVNTLKQIQKSDGSWEEGIYTTALALQALNMADREVPNPDLASLSGKVVDGDSSIALSNIQIDIESSNTNLSITTDSDGTFSFKGLENGTYTLHISSENFAPLYTILTMTGDNIDLGTLRLNKNINATISVLKGVIKDAKTNLPLEGAVVSAGSYQSVTDNNGNYTIDSIETGTYTVIVNKAGYIQSQKMINLPANTIYHYNSTLRTIDFTVEAIIKGVIVDKETDLMLEGVRVELSGDAIKSITTTTDGRFDFTKLSQGTYHLAISKPGYGSMASDITITQSSIIDYGMITLYKSDPAVQTAIIKGIAIDEETNIPLEGVQIQVGNLSALTDQNGAYEIDDLPVGSLSISVSKEGYLSQSAQTQAQAGSTIIFSPKLQQISAELSIIGTIFDADSSEPLEGVKVELNGESNTTVYTDMNGYYRISPVTLGTIYLKYSKLGYETMEFSTEIGLNSLNLSPSLKPLEKDKPDNDATLYGVALDSTTNEPLEDVHIHIKGMFTDETLSTDADGNFRLEHILSYDLNITFTKAEYKTVDTMVVLEQNENFDMEQVRMRPLSADILFPDLVTTDINVSDINIAQDKLNLHGTISIKVTNQGKVVTDSGFSVLAFYDTNLDGNYSESEDIILGRSTTENILEIEDNVTISIAVDGKLPYVNAPITLWVDSQTQIVELNEENNIINSSDRCTVIPKPLGAITLKQKWHWRGSHYSTGNANILGPVMVAQLNDDNGDDIIDQKDIPDVIFSVYASNAHYARLAALNGDTGKPLWINWSQRVTGYGSGATGDIDNDGLMEIVMVNNNRTRLYAFENDGTLKWSAVTGPGFSIPRDAISIADINHDGNPEIIHGRRVYDNTGRLLWVGTRDHGGETGYGLIPIVADIDMQGDMEIIADRTAYRSDGSVLWHRGDISTVGGFTAVGNFDSDEFPEIVLVAGSRVYLLDHTGKTIWGGAYIPGGGAGGAPTVGNFDDDPLPEIGVAGANYYVVYDTDGSILWKSRTKDASSNRTGSSLFDFNADGKVEVVYADEYYLRIYESDTGKLLAYKRIGSGTTLEYPVIADIDNDGHAEILIGANGRNASSRKGLYALEGINDDWAPTRSIWNQHSYHINNINDDGSIPRVEEPSWLGHNTYRLNTFMDRDLRSAPDLSVSLLSLNESEDTNLTLYVRVGNGGSDKLRSTTNVSFYDGNPTNGGTFIGSQEITSLEKGEYIDITLENIDIPVNDRIYVVVDPEDKISECDETNNRMDIPVTASKLAGEITTSTDSPSYTANQLAHLLATSTNIGKLEANLTAGLIIEDTHGNVVQSFDPVDLGIVASGESRTINSEWNTTTTLAGTYILKGILTDRNGNVVDESNTSFNIIGEDVAGVSATLDVTTDRLRYHTTDTVLISNFIQSLSSNSIISDTRVELQITDVNGTVVNTQTLMQGDLLPSSTKEANTHYEYIRLAVGHYTVHATLYGGSHVYSADTTLFEVYEDLTQALKGTVSVAWHTELAGIDQTCNYSVTNFGSTSLQGLPIKLRVMDLNRSTVVQTFAKSVDINTTDTVRDAETFTTKGYEAEDYSCALYAQTGSVWTLLDHEQFTVEVPPIIIEATIERKGKGRLLILLDPCESNETNVSCEEPFGSVDAANLTVQRTYLENLLTTHGYSYTIVTDADSFSNELRSGTYATYALLDETVKLSKTTQNELREAVFKGEGLLVSGTHDSRNHFVYETLGVEYRGHHSKVESIEVSGEGYSYFEATLLDKTHAINFDAEETARLANYLPEGKKATLPSAVKYTFGKGESIFAGFDVLAESSTYPQSAYGNFLLEALADIYQGNTQFIAGDIIPMTLEVINEGIATPIRTDINLSNNAQFIDAIGADTLSAQSLSFTEALLEEDETKTYHLWLQALSANSNIELIAQIFSLLDDNEVEQAQLSYSIVIGNTEDMESIVAQTGQIVLSSKQDSQRFKQVIKELEQAKSYKDTGDLSNTLAQLIKATDILQDIEEKEAVKALRVMIDQQIREIEIEMNKVGE